MSKIKHSSGFRNELLEYLRSDDLLVNECFRLPAVRDLLTKDRYFNTFSSEIEFGASDKVTAQAIDHNSDELRMFFHEMSLRPDLISKPLSCLNAVAMHAYKMKVLTIGCRTEAEIFSLVNAGFDINNIKGVDLFSYTPLIEIGDVTDLPYSDNQFDVVVCGWVLEFVTDIDKAVSEIKRVTKKDGFIAIGGMHHPTSLDLKAYNKRANHEDRVWYASVEGILAAFMVSHQDCVFQSEIYEEDLDKRGEVIVIFRYRGQENV